jgi:RNA polymerase sigma factor (sigma-70 family)
MDETAALIEPHVPALRRYAWALVRDREAADDLVQDCLERALSRWSLRRRDGELRPWLFAILHNLFIDGLRRRRREGTRVDLDLAADLPGAEDGAEHRAVLRDVVEALDSLPPEQRTVLLLVAVEELSYEAAAHITGVPIGTVMSRLSRARQRMRRMMSPASGSALRRVK